MDSLSKDLVLIVLQFLREEKFKDTVHTLERESGFFFNMWYFEEKVHAGEWDDAEKYLSGFTKVEDNRYSLKIYYELRKHKYLEALDRKDKPEALDILLKDLKVFSTYNSDLYTEITKLLTLDNFRENQKFSRYGDTKEARSILMLDLKKIIKANPLLNDKLDFPSLRSSRLRTLINQSLNWQHQTCRNPRPIPDIKTLFSDHSCGSSHGAFGGAMPWAYRPLGVDAPFPVAASAANPNTAAGWVSNNGTASSVQPAVIPSQVSGTKRPFTPPITLGMSEFHSSDHEQSLKHLRTAQPIEEATNPAIGQQSSQSLDVSLTLGSLATLNGDEAVGRNKEISNPVKDVVDKTKPWQLTDTIDPIPLRLLTLDASDTGNKVSRLSYTNSGTGILVLGSSGLQKHWKWECNKENLSEKATTKVVPQLQKPNSGLLMENDIAGVDLKKACPCMDLSKNDSYLMSAFGGKISLFNMKTYRVMTTFMSPPPVSTSVAFHPHDKNIAVVGMEDSVIYIYNIMTDEVKSILKGHQKRVMGLAFSSNLNILISSGADAHICLWSIDTWEKIKSVPLQLPAGHSPNGDARVQFHSNQVHFLVSHETQLALYDATNVDRMQQWIPQDILAAPISYAAFSCDSQLIYASFYDGNVGIFDADSLSIRCCLSPSMYLPQEIQGTEVVYPLVVAAHPQDPHQFALGLTDGSVKVIEPFELEGKWGVSEPAHEEFANDRGASTSTSNQAAAHVQGGDFEFCLL